MIEVPKYVSVQKAQEILNYSSSELQHRVQVSGLGIAAYCEPMGFILPLYCSEFQVGSELNAFFAIPEHELFKWDRLKIKVPKGKFFLTEEDDFHQSYFNFASQEFIEPSEIYVCGHSIENEVSRYWISSDFRSVMYKGNHFELTFSQEKALRYLFNKNRAETYIVRQEEVLDEIEYGDQNLDRRLSKVFRYKGKPHPLWGSVLKTPSRGYVTLEMPAYH